MKVVASRLAQRISPFLLVLSLLNASGGITYKDTAREVTVWREVPQEHLVSGDSTN